MNEFLPRNLFPQLREAVRRVALARKGVPVLCGSSLKNRGVQPLLDAVAAYLPAPDERNRRLASCYKGDLCALAFKVLHDKQRGPLVFLRVYSGSVKPQSAMYNVNRDVTERMSRLLLPFADRHVELPSLSAGNIAVAVGLKRTVTGDTIVSSKASAAAAAAAARGVDGGSGDGKASGRAALDGLLLAGVEVPEPVFFCTVEPPSVAKQADLERALDCLRKEDPSLKVRTDPDSGQTVLCGMGELHVEILHDRLRREYNLETSLGPLQVAYRETVDRAATATDILDRTLGDRRHAVSVELSVAPGEAAGPGSSSCRVAYEEEPRDRLSAEIKGAVEAGVQSACLQGPVLGYPVRGVLAVIRSVCVEPGTSLAMVSACVSRCVLQALRQAGGRVLEPVMSLEVTVDDRYLGSVLGDLARRRGTVRDVRSRGDGKVLLAAVPLAETMGYSTALRTLTSGTAAFSLELASYEPMNPRDQNALLEKTAGLA